jgi:hypothetical protein
MRINRLAAGATFVWCVAAFIQSVQSRSYAQDGAGNPELPYDGLATLENGPAFHVINSAEGETSTAVRGSGAIGIIGASATSSGTGVIGMAAGDLGIGVIGSGRSYGVLGATEGHAGVVGRFRTLETGQVAAIEKGGTFTANQGLLGVRNAGVVGYATHDGARGVIGVFSRDPLEDVSEVATAIGLNRGLLGTEQSGVQGESDTDGGFGVAGKATGGKNAVAIYGQGGPAGFAGFFRGRVTITERLLIERIDANEIYAAKGLTGGAKLFKIDHPLDPANQFLSHGSVESSELKNVYDGVVTLDGQGRAEVSLPDWFEALNRDFRYQLTPIGAPAALYIAQEIEDGRFRIGGGQPGLKVSWQVTGVRQDAYARAHPVIVERMKSRTERGKYLHPTELGFSKSVAIHRRDNHGVSFEQDDTPRGAPNVRLALAHSTSVGVRR